MRVVCISDTHGTCPELPDGDLLIHAGDLTSTGTEGQTKGQLDWLKDESSRYQHGVILIPGNHEYYWEHHVPYRRYCEERGLTVLVNEETERGGLKVWGSPYTPAFGRWGFQYERGADAIAQWAQIPDDTDILITHGPPYGILDMNLEGFSCGCEALLDRVYEVRPQLHVFGHIHEDRGEVPQEDITFVNASIMNRSYSPVHEPITVEI